MFFYMYLTDYHLWFSVIDIPYLLREIRCLSNDLRLCCSLVSSASFRMHVSHQRVSILLSSSQQNFWKPSLQAFDPGACWSIFPIHFEVVFVS